MKHKEIFTLCQQFATLEKFKKAALECILSRWKLARLRWFGLDDLRGLFKL